MKHVSNLIKTIFLFCHLPDAAVEWRQLQPDASKVDNDRAAAEVTAAGSQPTRPLCAAFG